jgi:glutathione S-transferase
MPIKLHKFGEAWGLADPSPFCVKLESFLREAKIDYQVAPFDLRRSFRRAPKGKMPFIEDEDGSLIGDSTLIIGRLSQRHAINLDAPLDDRAKAISHAFRRMLDEHFYWVAVYSRWCDEPGWSIIRDTFFARMPALTRPLATAMAKRGMLRALRAQGVGRHSREEIYKLGTADMRALSALLGDDHWFFGADNPTLLDLWAHAFFAEIVVPPIPSPLRDAASGLPNLCAHVERMQARLYRAPGAAGDYPPVAKPG